MRVLVVGANGLLGSNVVAASRSRGWETIGTYRSEEPALSVPVERFDVRNEERFRRLLARYQPDLVVNCAAFTDVDGCEHKPKEAHAVNGEAPGHLASACAVQDVHFVHISTDYVFDGKSPKRYEESSPPNPIQTYGETKLAGERAVAEANDAATVARLSFVYGVHRSTGELTGFPAWVAGRLREGTSTSLFADQRITPSRAGGAAETVVELGVRCAAGTYHVASRSCVTPYAFGHELCAAIGADASLLEEGSQSDVERPATRPGDTCLNVEKVVTELGRPQPTVAEDLVALDEVL